MMNPSSRRSAEALAFPVTGVRSTRARRLHAARASNLACLRANEAPPQTDEM